MIDKYHPIISNNQRKIFKTFTWVHFLPLSLYIPAWC